MSIVDQSREVLDLESLDFPPVPPVDAIEVEDYVNWDGDDALRVTVVLADETSDDMITGERVIAIKRKIRDRLRGHGITLFPYIHFVTEAERQALAEEENSGA